MLDMTKVAQQDEDVTCYQDPTKGSLFLSYLGQQVGVMNVEWTYIDQLLQWMN
jgi:hypothetical protein